MLKFINYTMKKPLKHYRGRPATPMLALLAEYHKLKKELFGTSKFAIVDKSDKRWPRYDQLFQFFYQQFRTQRYVSPIQDLIDDITQTEIH